jgi:succinyl-CoA synthetase beta subunit
MDLLEYQAKELFQEVGIPVLPSQTIHDPSELKRLTIPYPVVLKSQVRAGGRGKAGGIRFVENTIDAIAATRAIFNLPILGEYPDAILAEARYDAQEEFFLAVLLDYQIQRPVLLGSAKGGMDVETLLQHMEKVVLTADFSPFHARRLAIAMGLRGELIEAVSGIIEKMYYLFRQKDLELIEINPLALSADGKVMALDGKIAANDSALTRHADLLCWKTPPASDNLSELQWLDQVDAKGTLGILCNSNGSALATWDLLAQGKGKLACGLVVEGSYPHPSFSQQLEAAIAQMLALPHLKAILINVFGNAETSEAAAQAIADILQPQPKLTVGGKSEDRMTRATAVANPKRDREEPLKTPSQPSSPSLPLVVRLVSGNLAPMQELLSALPVYWTDNLEEAVTQAIALTKAK